jgi:hypothetical protein
MWGEKEEATLPATYDLLIRSLQEAKKVMFSASGVFQSIAR